jgi:uncharacterized membrane protein
VPGNGDEGIRSLHERIDELHRLVAQRLEAEGKRPASWLHEHSAVHLPAWKRPTNGEARWQVALCTAAAIALQVAVPERLVLLRPAWILLALQGLLLIVLVTANPHRINRESRLLRSLGLTLAALLSLVNGWSVVRLATDIVDGTPMGTPRALLITGAAIWLTNVIIFALWYWEFDRGGPVNRFLGTRHYPDLMFPQMASPELAPADWEPVFVDYLYFSFTNATAFSPTDVMPLARWAKLTMLVQSAVSLAVGALVIARAVNIL